MKWVMIVLQVLGALVKAFGGKKKCKHADKLEEKPKG